MRSFTQSAGSAKGRLHRNLSVLMRRRIGNLREDADFDAIVRSKDLQIAALSFFGIIVMVTLACITWYHNPLSDVQLDVYPDNAGPTLLNLMLLAQALLTLSTLITCVLIAQRYRLILRLKRVEWSGIDLFELHQANMHGVLEVRHRFNKSYSFWASGLWKQCLLEILVHLPHPIVWMAQSDTTPNIHYKVFQIFMFLRLYLIPRVIHVLSFAYRNRFEIVNSDKEMRQNRTKITQSFTVKLFAYARTVFGYLLTIGIVVFAYGFAFFFLERPDTEPTNPGDTDNYGRLENCFWFIYVTYTTIGYGDYFPITLIGRIVCVSLGMVGSGIIMIFSGILTNKIAPTNEQSYIVEFLAVNKCQEAFRGAAQNLIAAVCYDYVVKKRQRLEIEQNAHLPEEELQARLERHKPRTSHKSNFLYDSFRTYKRARRDLESAFMQPNDPVLDEKVQVVEDIALALQAEVKEHHHAVQRTCSEINLRFKRLADVVAGYGRDGNVPI